MRRALLLVLPCILNGVFAHGQAVPPPHAVEVSPGVRITLPAPWFVADRSTNGLEIAYPLTRKAGAVEPGVKPESGEQLITADARTTVVTEHRASHEAAVERLVQIAMEERKRPELLVIAGWPALERRSTATLPDPGETDTPMTAETIVATTAIAAGDVVILFETELAPDADPELAQAAQRIARHIEVREGNREDALRDVERMTHSIEEKLNRPEGEGKPEAEREAERGAERDVERGAEREAGRGARPEGMMGPKGAGISNVQSGVGELEVAITNDGKHVVVAANSGYAYSDNGGLTFTHGGKTPCIFTHCDGDPSLAIGKSGHVYYSWIGAPKGQPGGNPPNGFTDSLSISINNGHTFKFLSNAVVCPAATPKNCTLSDQPHIAADRVTYSTKKADRVYMVWRNFFKVGNTPEIVCSIDGGKTWSGSTIIDPAGDYPRIQVGGDGAVYVAYHKGAQIMLHKFSTCDSGLVPQTTLGFPITVSAYTKVACPALPGLDRCNDGNTLSSQMVAIDPTNASHVFMAYATNTAPNNENIEARVSLDGGVKWGPPVRINNPVPARRFMPWVCAVNGTAAISWYDRRAATAAKDDLTAYFRGSARLIEPPGVLQAGPEADVSGSNDPQCASGWPRGERNPLNASSCSTPQLAGECQLPCSHTKAGCPGGKNGSLTACTFTGGPAICKAPETCQTWGGGVPKYGDYNGNACAVMNANIPGAVLEVPSVCTAWASATPPAGVTREGQGIQIYASCDSLGFPVTIHYHQVGACNGFPTGSGIESAGPKAAYVIFAIESIDNSHGSTSFGFNPSNLYLQQSIRDFFNPGLMIYPDILKGRAAVPQVVPGGDDLKLSPIQFGALIVQTSAKDGAVEADKTPYFLVYNRKPLDPPVNLVKSDEKQTSWPLTEDCTSIVLH